MNPMYVSDVVVFEHRQSDCLVNWLCLNLARLDITIFPLYLETPSRFVKS